MKKKCFIFFLLFLSSFGIYGQTCCSGGVPLSGNLGFTASESGLLQLSINYDYNLLNTLYNENNILDDDSRKRLTHSLLIQSGYNFSESLSVDVLFSFVQQEREITQFNNINYTRTRGIGDAVILLKYRVHKLSNYSQDLLLGFGSKLPTGRSDLKTTSGISLNADLQPGSGSYDFIYWIHYQKIIQLRPTAIIYSRFIYRQNGTNNHYLKNQSYKFGNELQAMLGIGDQLMIKNLVLNPGIALKYRNKTKDIINDFQLDNTGGDWLYLVGSLGIHLNQNILFNVMPEIPIYTKVDGTQLSTDLRINMGIYLVFNNSKNNLNI